MPNVSDINQLKAGAKLTEGQGAFWRANSDNSVTLFKRIRGKDSRVGRYDRPLTAARLREARAAAASLLSPKATAVAPVLSGSITLAELWEAYSSQRARDWSEGYYEDSVARIRMHVEPHDVFQTDITQITTPMLVATLKPLRLKQLDTETKVRGLINQCFEYAVAMGYCENNPVASIPVLWRTLGLTADTQQGLPALTDLNELRGVLRASRQSYARLAVRVAAEVQARLVQRSDTILGARWDDIRDGVLVIPRERLRKRPGWPDQALVLPARVRALLDDLPKRNEFIFASASSKHRRLTIESLSKHYSKGLGLKGVMVPHGWRSSFRTIMGSQVRADGSRRFDLDVIEECLDHTTGSKVTRAYTREKPVQAMGLVLEAWGDLLDEPV